ncbi:MAG: hypothetical protein IJW29_01940 [Clostridia bacterium]|nr:hypothetical protein [Clostridia bacterium]
MTNGYINGNSRGRGTVVITKERFQAICLTALVLATVVLLLLRDAYSVNINKYLFVAIAIIGTVALSTENFTCFMFFSLPLYFGLPGNYITILFLARILLSYQKLKLKRANVCVAILICLFMVLQNVFTGYSDVVHFMFLLNIILIVLLFAYRTTWKTRTILLCYSFGVAMLGIIMLISTLQVYEFNELMSSSLRLGDAQYASESTAMHVSVDPNYYGAYTISALAMSVPFLQKKGPSALAKTILIICLLAALAVCLIGLSRSFVLVLALWILLYLISQKKWKNILVTLVVLTIIAIIVVRFMPNVVESLLRRFNESDMATANGRTNQIGKYYNSWMETLPTMLFGIGMFNCEIHCTPLQFLFGGGLVLFGLILVFAFTLKPQIMYYKKPFYETYLPVLATFVMMLTIPAATLINSIFPLVITYFHSCYIKSQKDGM